MALEPIAVRTVQVPAEIPVAPSLKEESPPMRYWSPPGAARVRRRGMFQALPARVLAPLRQALLVPPLAPSVAVPKSSYHRSRCDSREVHSPDQSTLSNQEEEETPRWSALPPVAEPVPPMQQLAVADPPVESAVVVVVVAAAAGTAGNLPEVAAGIVVVAAAAAVVVVGTAVAVAGRHCRHILLRLLRTVGQIHGRRPQPLSQPQTGGQEGYFDYC